MASFTREAIAGGSDSVVAIDLSMHAVEATTPVLLTLLVAPFMRFDHEHFLFFDEVYEWSGSVLLLHLALWERGKCTFTR